MLQAGLPFGVIEFSTFCCATSITLRRRSRSTKRKRQYDILRTPLKLFFNRCRKNMYIIIRHITRKQLRTPRLFKFKHEKQLCYNFRTHENMATPNLHKAIDSRMTRLANNQYFWAQAPVWHSQNFAFTIALKFKIQSNLVHC